MDGIASGIEGFISEVRGYAAEVDSEIADRDNDFRSMCLWNIHNRAVMALEVVGFYAASWSRIAEITPELESELSERIITVTKNMFTDIVSSIEKAVKDCVSVYRDSGLEGKSLECNKNYLYLRNIIQSSATLGYISNSTYAEWDSILMMRNLVTHNNSASDRRGVFDACGVHIVMRPNRMMKGPQDTFVRLSRRITELFHEWLVIIHGRFS